MITFMRVPRPYATAVATPLPLTTRSQRQDALREAGYNPFRIPANNVTIDLLSDSGTGALSTGQAAAAQQADESYAGATSYYRWRKAVSDLLPHAHLLPTHQGRAAERILDAALLKPGQLSVSNTHFDTTRANLQLNRVETRDLPCPEASDLDSEAPFKGNIDLDALRATFTGPDGHRVGQVLITVTNNGLGGQPVSLDNLEAAHDLARAHGVPLVLDAARFAENAWLITRRDPAYRDHAPRDVARTMLGMCDVCMISLKKDGLAHAGGLLAIHDDDLADECEALLIATEGYSTYGGLTGATLDVIAHGLREVLEPAYLADREQQLFRFAGMLGQAGADYVRPAGMHAVYLNAGRLLPHLRPSDFPGHSLVAQLYLDGGIRAAELGSLYLGEFDDRGDLVKPAPFELVRLAVPRRVYDTDHLAYVADVVAGIHANPERVTGQRIMHAPKLLRHFRIRTGPAS